MFGRKIRVGALLALAVCLLAGIFLPERRALAAAGEGIEESLGFLSQMNPRQFVNLDGLVITEEQYEEIRAFTEQITEGVSTEAEKIEVIYSFILSGKKGARHPDYVLQAGETDNDPYPMFAKMDGVCHGCANLFRTMCVAVNIPCINVGGNFCPLEGGEFAHAWNFVYCDGKWCLADSMQAKMDLTGSKELWKYFHVQCLKAVLMEENGYQITYDEGLAVIGYTGNATELVIPETCKDGEWTITAVDCSVPVNTIGGVTPLIGEGIEKLVLPKTVTTILNIDAVRAQTLREVTVDADNPAYSSHGGVIYDKGGTETVYIPRGIEELELRGTGVIEKNALYGLNNLRVLRFAEGTTELQGWAVENCPNLESVYIPDSVRTIDSQAFEGCGTAFTIYASEGSAGAAFAEANGIKTEVPSKTEPEDKEPEDKEPEDKEPEDKEPEVKEPVDKESDNKGTAVKEPDETELGKTDITDKEPNRADTDTVKLKKVTNLKVKYKTNKKIILSWKKDKAAGGYEIYRLQGKKWRKIKKVAKKTRVTIVRGSAKKYQYKVRAYKKVNGKMYYGAFSKKLKVKKK